MATHPPHLIQAIKIDPEKQTIESSLLDPKSVSEYFDNEYIDCIRLDYLPGNHVMVVFDSNTEREVIEVKDPETGETKEETVEEEVEVEDVDTGEITYKKVAKMKLRPEFYLGKWYETYEPEAGPDSEEPIYGRAYIVNSDDDGNFTSTDLTIQEVESFIFFN